MASTPPQRRSPARLVGRAAYAAGQGARVAWYAAHSAAVRRLSHGAAPAEEPKFQPQKPAGDPAKIRALFLDLFAQDRANIEAGLYPAPRDFGLEKALAAVRHSLRFFADLPQVDARRRRRGGVEIRDAERAHREGADKQRFPAYYLQNFHYQTDGWLTAESAALYDTQVEVLFGGAADAMRRVTIGMLLVALAGRDQRKTRLLDVGCGTGRLLSQLLEARPRLLATGLDLSPAYAAEARAQVAPWRQAEIVVGAAEKTPFADAHFDAAICIYLFHELPPRVRRETARELARIIAPGGVLVLADSVQWGDCADFERMLEAFPVGFHEPFYSSYLAEDLPAMFAEAGFALEETKLAYLTKAMRFRRI